MSSESETGKIKKSSIGADRGQKASSEKRAVHRGPKLQIRQLVCFRLDDDNFGIDVHLVDEIRRAQGIVATGTGPTHVCGTVTVQDRKIEVVDVRSSLDYPARPVDNRARIILIGREERMRGMLVDTVSEVIRITGGPEKTKAPAAGRVDPDLLREWFLVDEQPITVLDWLRILDL